MQEFEVKRGHTKDLVATVTGAIRENFGLEPAMEGEKAVIAFGALSRLEAWPGPGGKTVVVNTVSRKDASEAEILDTNRRFRVFLEKITGFNAKERVKRAKKAVEKG
ncbi:MAG: DUF5611 family protein [Methanomicrobiales archaeon]|nr:DUF5611 family protein [Methanomicrobiales archaeon]